MLFNAYTARRLVLFIPTLLIVSLLIFSLMRIMPGDLPSILAASDEGGGEDIERYRQQLGLDRPLHVQYFTWIADVSRGDFGTSMVRPQVSVADEVAKRAPRSLQLALMALPIAIATGIPIGMVSGLFRNSWIDHTARLSTFLGLSIPNFVLGTLVLFFLLRFLEWRPPLGFLSITDDPVGNFSQMIWPALVLAWGPNAALARVTRSSVLEVMGQDYVRTARAKGLTASIIAWRHVLPNSLLPVVTLIGFQFANMLSGVVIVETIFNIPGLGLMMVDGIQLRDYPVVQNLVLLAALVVLTFNLLTDLVYPLLDPRVKSG